MTDTLLYALPTAPDLEHREAHWWHVVDGVIVASGTGEEWLALAEGERTIVALAPAGAVRIVFRDKGEAATARQAETVARVAATEASLGDQEALHAVSTSDETGTTTAIVDNGQMLAWLDWARELGADPAHIVPSAAIIPLADDWVAAAFGAEHIVGRRCVVMPNEPELVALIVGDAEVRELDQSAVDEAIARAAETWPLDLRTGRFGRRRRIVIERNRIRELALLAASIAVITLLWSLISIFKLESSTDRLNEDTLAIAQAAVGQAVTLETAESALTQRTGGSAYGGFITPLTGLYDALRPEEPVTTTAIAYAPDGTMTTTLAAPTVDSVNRVLVSLQRRNYRVTAVPRQSPDGRAMVETTIRSGP